MNKVLCWYAILMKFAFSQLEKHSLSAQEKAPLHQREHGTRIRLLSLYVAFKNGQFLHNSLIYFAWVVTCLGNFHSLMLKHLRQLLVWLLLVYVHECILAYLPFPCFAMTNLDIIYWFQKKIPNILNELIWLTHCVQQWDDCHNFYVLANL